ncbi:hypothetical protein LTR97_003496 [Elasticomyces elasticus]|uniref:Uncharacterized protein n=1 Tax=Elasticomyces elasticus TaxID=574655 RepID=A0AAN7W973_9PEZI|nr:hypothetical protein LTR97_003496 [Elasticomyces elasticus]
MSHKEEQSVGLGIEFADDDVNDEQNNTDLATEPMQEEEAGDDGAGDQTAEVDHLQADEEGEVKQGPDHANLQSSWSPDSSEGENDGEWDGEETGSADLLDATSNNAQEITDLQASNNPAQESTDSQANNNPEQNDTEPEPEATDAQESIQPQESAEAVPVINQPSQHSIGLTIDELNQDASRRLKASPPRQPFWFVDRGDDDLDFYNWRSNTRWGIGQENLGLFPREFKSQTVGPYSAPNVPSLLHKSKSVNDLTSPTSPTKCNPVSPTNRSQDDSVLPSYNDPRWASQGPSSLHNGNPSRDADNDAGTNPLPSSSRPAKSKTVLEDINAGRFGSSWADDDDEEEEDMSWLVDEQHRASEQWPSEESFGVNESAAGASGTQGFGTHETESEDDDWLGAGPTQPETTDNTDDQQRSNDVLPASSQTDDGAQAFAGRDNEDAPEPMPTVHRCGESDNETSPERAPTRNGLREPERADPEDGTITQDDDQSFFTETLEPVAAPENNEGMSPTSPTPSDASSVESTTGLTTSEGLARAHAYRNDPDPPMSRFRTQLKEENAGNPRVSKLPEDPQERFKLLETRVHEQRGYIRKLQDELEYAKEKWEEAVDAHDDMVQQRDEAQEMRNRMEDDLRVTERELYDSQQQLYRSERRREGLEDQLDEGREGYEQLSNQQEQSERQLQELRQRHETVLQQLEQAETEVARLRGEMAALTEAAAAQQSTDLQHTTTSIGTQIGEEGSAESSSSSSEHDQEENRPQTLLPTSAVRWPTDHRTDTARQIARWINATHQAERGSEIEPLTADLVLDMLGNDGTTNVSRLTDLLEQAGYVFRTDRFAQEVVDIQRLQGIVPVEPMFNERRFTTGDNAASIITRLLDEVNGLYLGEHRNLARTHRDMSENYENALDKLRICRKHGGELEKRLSDFEEKVAAAESELADCRKIQSVLQATGSGTFISLQEVKSKLIEVQSAKDAADETAKSATDDLASTTLTVQELETTIRELREKESKFDHEEFETIKNKLKDCCEARRALQAEHDGCAARIAELERQLTESKAARVVAEEKAESTADAVSDAKATIEGLEAEIQELRDTNIERSVGVEVTRLNRRIKLLSDEVEALKKEESVHLEMLQTARKTIIELEALASKPRRAPPALDEGDSPHAPSATPLSSLRATRQAERNARAQQTEAYRQAVETLRGTHETALKQRDEIAELRRQAYVNLHGRKENAKIPYVKEKDRKTLLLEMIGSKA